METKTFEQILDENGTFVYKSVGVSMLPLIREGRDYILIKKRPSERLKKYDVVLYKRPNVEGRGKYVLHRILKVNNDDTYWIVGDNCVSGETVKEENIFGVLFSMKRKRKTINLSGFRYGLYVYFWCAPYHIRFFVIKCKNFSRRIVSKILKILHLKKKK